MRTAAQRTKLLGGSGPIARLAETFATPRQGLVCTKHQPPREQSCNRSGLGTREVARNRSRIGNAGFSFLGALVDLSWPYLDTQASRGKNLATNLTSRREHKGLGI
jgi:hypothetical protein